MTAASSARIAGWAAASVTAAGVIYAAGIVAIVAVSPGRMPHPTAATRWWAALGTLATCPPIVVLFWGLHRLSAAPTERTLRRARALATGFGLIVATSRVVFLSAGGSGRLGATVLAAEVFSWGILLSLAMIAATPLFAASLRRDAAIGRLALAYGAIGMSSAAAYAVGSSWYFAGFLAWGLVLYLWTARVSRWCFRLSGTLRQGPD